MKYYKYGRYVMRCSNNAKGDDYLEGYKWPKITWDWYAEAAKLQNSLYSMPHRWRSTRMYVMATYGKSLFILISEKEAKRIIFLDSL